MQRLRRRAPRGAQCRELSAPAPKIWRQDSAVRRSVQWHAAKVSSTLIEMATSTHVTHQGEPGVRLAAGELEATVIPTAGMVVASLTTAR